MAYLKKIIFNIHLILGLASGIIFFIVAVTGCMYLFKPEIERLTQPYRSVEAKQQAFLPPSKLIHIAENVFPERHIHGVSYGQQEDAAEVQFYESSFHHGIFINPYSGDILKVKNYEKDFFDWVFHGHYQLWLPQKTGKFVVSTATLIFVVLLITGIVLWWPRKGSKRSSFRIQWKAPWKDRIFDLHNVLGFYAGLVLLVIAITGLAWGYQWFSQMLYSATGGEKELNFKIPDSDTTSSNTKNIPPMDYVWKKMHNDYPDAAMIEIHTPPKGKAIFAFVKPDEQTYWESQYRYFDPNTLEEKEVETIWGKIENANTADKIKRLNYDIHTGAIAGLPGKILVFFASLIGASLPVTGCLMWIRREREKQKLKSKMKI